MPDLKLCSEPDQVSACATCRRNPDNWPEIERNHPRQTLTKPDVRNGKCGTHEEMGNGHPR